jgi:hypothetical protein
MKNEALASLAGAALSLALMPPAQALERDGYRLSVLVDGTPRPEYSGRAQSYVEALRGRRYALQVTNPLPYRVAVALSVDGLNTIDARHLPPAQARKWVLEAQETIEIEGWQTSDHDARRFFFTGEGDSYGAWLGKTRDLGVIEAVFFRERHPEPRAYASADQEAGGRLLGFGRLDSGRGRAPAPPRGSEAEAKSSPLDDDYAATGIGERTDHRVHQVHLDLETTPSAVLRIRYEFRPVLVRLGILPRPAGGRPIDRRETARGFEGPYCPDPDGRAW